MLVDIVNPGWAAVCLRSLANDVPDFIDAGDHALTYPWKHFIGGHLGWLGTREPHSDAPAIHGGYRRQLTSSPLDIRRPRAVFLV